jgi:uncharacterized membrane protein
MILGKWFLWFITYGFLGWVYESAVCSIEERRLVNRGFLNGPVCPVYGFGALATIFLLYQRTDNVLVCFFAGMLITCTVEYITAVLLEKLFEAKWVDYSNHRFNLQGRVSLLGAVVFGVLSVLLVKHIHPVASGLIDQLPDWALVASAIFLFLAMMLDLYVTVRHLLLLNGRLKEIQSAFNHFMEQYTKRTGELKNALFDKFEESEYYSERIKKLFSLNRFQSRRIARAFPKLKSLKYNDAWQKLKSMLLNNN